ncbi:type 1 glutamine amidotransferase [Pseudothauera rhizosphaerae]|uniref:Type 1 glutamine amidotransferase n=2 Tax=Pseudothauera rhizosphaerae TaxID=2565932 RepID=A0A4S4A852_9RHOO|nr:type 1 glutamine amidotransferase [Pseudothauera rhizosphaerae]
MRKRAHILQHVPFEGPGSIGPWLEAAGYAATRTRFFESAALPAADDVDLLVVMGGPMSVNDEPLHPWLADEKRFVRAAMEAGTPVLGICLGAQLMAAALGAAVRPNGEKEIGWFPVEGLAGGGGDGALFSFPPSTEVFHWHGETFDLPPGAVRLASSRACANQAFQYGERAIGLQFHLETTPETAREIVAHCRDELVPARFVQAESDLLSAPPARYAAINGLMGRILAWLTRPAV